MLLLELGLHHSHCCIDLPYKKHLTDVRSLALCGGADAVDQCPFGVLAV
jgi:hypothetical protein